MDLKDKDSLGEAFRLLQEMRTVDTAGGLRRFEAEMSTAATHTLFYRFRKGILYGAAVLIPALLLLNAYLLYKTVETHEIISDSRIRKVEVTAMNGTRVFYTLPDGTSVWLRGGSKLIFDENMHTAAERRVKLVGEGYFNVKSNHEQPFIVALGKLDVKVTGTAFNCNTDYPGQIQLTLVEGEVEMNKRTTDGDLLLATLHPGNYFNYNVREHTFHIDNVDVRKYTGWKDGYLLFDDDLMKDVVERISYWYGVDITIADKEIENMRFTAMFTDLKLAQIIDILELSSNVTATYIKGAVKDDGSIQKEQLILRKKQ